jgi:hypothetical protein
MSPSFASHAFSATLPAVAQSRRGFLVRKRTVAVLVLLGLSSLVGLLADFGMAYLLLPLFLAVVIGLAFQSPPAVGTFLLYGWIILPSMDVPPIAGFPRLPATSLVAAGILAALALQRVVSGSMRRLLRPSVFFYLGLFALIFALGYLGIYLHGKWGSVLFKTLAWQKLISCGSMFACGLLCCRDRTDLHFIFRAIPFWFLMYALYLPIGVYLGFAQNLVTGTSAYSAGLAFGVLNANTLGQGACLAAIVAAALLTHSRSSRRDRFIFSMLLVLAAGITLASASRQSLLALLIGLAFLIVRLRPFIGILLLVVIVSAASTFLQWLGAASEDRAFLSRFSDISKSSEEWSTGSYSERWREIELALPHLGDRPLIGYGFGGYSLARDIPDVRSRNDFNESNFLNDLWNDGYFVVGEHNFPIALYLQTGAIGVAAFLSLVLGPYFRLRWHNRFLPAAEKETGRVDDVVVASLLIVIFVMQNISGGFAPGSMGMLFFVVGAMVAGVDAPRWGRRRAALGNSPLRASGAPQIS